MKGICEFCGNLMQKISEDEYNCPRCGFGWNGKGKPSMKDHLKKVVNLTKYLMTQFPNKEKNEYVAMVMEKLHGIEKHPVNRDGYCEYCNLRYE